MIDWVMALRADRITRPGTTEDESFVRLALDGRIRDAPLALAVLAAQARGLIGPVPGGE